MIKYIVKRLALLIVVIIGVSFLIFTIMDFAPGDLILNIMGEEVTDEQYEIMREQLGLNDPLLVRYVRYIWNLLHGDLGYSHKYRMPVWDLYSQRAGATFLLAFAATIVALLISIPLGIYTALRQGSVQDNLASAFSIIGLAAPNFWVGLMLILAFSLHLGWFHSGGFRSWADVILPAITLGTGHIAMYSRMTRSSMIDVIRQDYLMLARAKGCKEKKVITKHALKNALIPIITTVGIQIASALGGAVITESVFSWPGIGKLIIDAIKSQDIDTVTGAIIMTSIITSLILLAIDILYAFVDPRIKAQYKRG
ncbi:MAG: ABC transporter permease [Sphaerochaetaceae bacterium]